ncbi:hypothetical protein DITRI_Ditri08aG0146200 [Diplodiscus trichospermus]
MRHLSRLRTSEAAPTSSSLSHKLDGLQDLHDCIDRLLQLPLTQQALAEKRKYVDELLDGFLALQRMPIKSNGFCSVVDIVHRKASLACIPIESKAVVPLVG